MRIAEEMYQYCKDKELAGAVSVRWARKNFPLIENALESGEEVAACFIGLNNYAG